ncbi:endonuclease [Shewanella corallii]|uniref:Endonuclease n=1 Tax=Shewanella corallii TaxID=560080 RepID=A0ABT0NE23_9GAMM|nr:endonuclease [Shewanella corallii]MCL2916042.1 endonuclease [Shewanella corallii]
MKYRLLAFLPFLVMPAHAFTPSENSEVTPEIEVTKGQTTITSFDSAKEILDEQVHLHDRITVYCGAEFDAEGVITHPPGFKATKYLNRYNSREWEHIVPADRFGDFLPSWKDGHPACVQADGDKYKGRDCARKVNEQFRLMEADMYNLFPAIGSVNGLRNYYPFALMPNAESDFGSCDMRIENRKAQPPERARGIIARTYLYMAEAYPDVMVLTPEEKTLMSDWDKAYPVSGLECRRAVTIWEIQKNVNGILEARCQEWGAFWERMQKAIDESGKGNNTVAMTMLNSLKSEYSDNEEFFEDLIAVDFNRANIETQSGDHQSALSITESIISKLRTGQKGEPQELMASALSLKALLLQKLGQGEKAISVIDELTDRFRSSRSIETQQIVAHTLNQALYIARGLEDESLERQIETDIIEIFGDSQDEFIQAGVLAAYRFQAGATCSDPEALDKCASLMQKVIKQFSHLDDVFSQFYIVEMTMELALIKTRQGRYEQSIKLYSDVVYQHGQSQEPSSQQAVIYALLSMAELHISNGEIDVAKINIANARDAYEGPDPILLIPSYMSFVLGDITAQQLIDEYKKLEPQLDMSLKNWGFGTLDGVIAQQGPEKKLQVDLVRQYFRSDIDLTQLEAQLNASPKH